MAADLAHTPTSGLTVQGCGDCHLANFGSYASPEGIPVFDINDFDETLRAPFEWDIKRLGTSLILAGAETGLADRVAQSLANIMAQTYCTEMARLSRLSPLQVWVNRVDLQSAIEHFENPKTRHRVETLLKQRLDSTRNAFGLISDDRNAPSLRECPPLTMRLPEQDTAIRAAFARYIATQPQERLALLNCYTLRDVIFKVVGIGSVGTFCAIGLFTTADNEPLLLQIKEAQASVLTPYVSGKSPFHNQGKRVVTGQRIMQAVSDSFLGWTDSPDDAPHNPAIITPTASSSPVPNDEERQFYVRRVKDTRLAAIGADFAQDGLEDYARLCGRVLARAHARSGDPVTISAYAGKGNAFADAIADFSVAYAQQTRQDWQHFVASTTGKSATGKKARHRPEKSPLCFRRSLATAHIRSGKTSPSSLNNLLYFREDKGSILDQEVGDPRHVVNCHTNDYGDNYSLVASHADACDGDRPSKPAKHRRYQRFLDISPCSLLLREPRPAWSRSAFINPERHTSMRV